jgi:cytochrome P450
MDLISSLRYAAAAAKAAEEAQVAAQSKPSKDELLQTKDHFFGHGVVRDPYPKLAELQAQCPVHGGSIPEYFDTIGPETLTFPDQQQYSVFSFDEAERVFKDQQQFSSSWYEPSIGSVIGRTILQMDPPEHTRYRQLIQGAFTKKEMERWEAGFVHDIVDSFLDKIVEKGRADLVADLALHYPLRVLAEAAALPATDVDTFYRWAAVLTNVSLPEQERRDAAEEFRTYLLSVIEQRRAEPGRDLVSQLVTSTFRGAGEVKQQLTTEEIVAFLRLLIPAGAQTTYRALCNLLYGLLTHPDQLAAIRQDPSLIPQAIEEGLRWEPPLVSFGRTAIADVQIADVHIPVGTPVNVVVGAADRDPRRWADPEAFDIFRPPQPHLAFGTGPHVCLGIHFARMEMRVAMHALMQRLPNLRLDPDEGDIHISGLGARSPDRLPVIFD